MHRTTKVSVRQCAQVLYRPDPDTSNELSAGETAYLMPSQSGVCALLSTTIHAAHGEPRMLTWVNGSVRDCG